MSTISDLYKKHTSYVYFGIAIMVLAVLLILGLGFYEAGYVTAEQDSTWIGCSGSSYGSCGSPSGLVIAEVIYILLLLLGFWMLIKYQTLDGIAGRLIGMSDEAGLAALQKQKGQ